MTSAPGDSPPWGELGFEVSGDDIRAEIRESPLGWRVVKTPLFCEDQGLTIAIPGRVALLREEPPMVLSVVSDDWMPMQNSDAVGLFDDFARLAGSRITTVGSLREGRIVWSLARMGDPFEVARGDWVQPFILFSNPQEYGKSMDVRLMYLRETGKSTYVIVSDIRIPHRGEPDLDVVEKTVDWLNAEIDKFEAEAREMSRRRLTDAGVMRYLAGVFSSKEPNTFQDLSKPARMAYEAMDGLSMHAPGTAWHAFTTICHVMDHHLGLARDTRVSSSWYGLNQGRKRRAASMALAQ